jgi:predicted XRE-type DNA-binding protein
MANFPSQEELKRVREKLNDSIASRPLPKDASKADKLKFKLCEKFIAYKNEHKITQRVLAEKLGINESLVSKITHYHYSEFTVDRLANYLDKIMPNFELEIIDAA